MNSLLPETAKEALALGVKKYFSGKPCKHGHVSLYWAKNHKCCECSLENTRRWRKKDPEKTKKLCADYYHKNTDKHKARSNDWKKRNHEHVNEYSRKWYWEHRFLCLKQSQQKRDLNPRLYKARAAAWYSRNIEKAKTMSANHRAKKIGAIGVFTEKDIKEKLDYQKRRCRYCNKDVSEKYHIDHIVPLFLGGSNFPNNLQILCPKCNLSKNKKSEKEFLEYLSLFLESNKNGI